MNVRSNPISSLDPEIVKHVAQMLNPRGWRLLADSIACVTVTDKQRLCIRKDPSLALLTMEKVQSLPIVTLLLVLETAARIDILAILSTRYNVAITSDFDPYHVRRISNFVCSFFHPRHNDTIADHIANKWKNPVGVIEKEPNEKEIQVRPEVEQDECVICLDGKRTHLIIPCGHQALCESCAEHHKKGKLEKCPVCRVVVQSTLKVFSP